MKYTIAIPAYKSTFLRECLNSVLSQTYNDYEVIILNDCSPEKIKDIVFDIKSNNHIIDIRYYENEKNVGAVNVVNNWNKLLELAKGDYFVCIGDDDMLSTDFLVAYNLLIDEYPNLNVYHARTLFIDEQSQFIGLQEDRPEWESVYSMIWHYVQNYRVQFIGDFLFNTNSIRNNGGFKFFPLAWCSDVVTSFINAVDKGIANSHNPTFFYRKNNFSITSSSNTYLKMESTKLYKEWLEEFLKIKPKENNDIMYWNDIKSFYNSKFMHNYIYMIGDDFSHSFFKCIFYWFNRRKKYGLSFLQYCYAAALGVALKFR